jgi:tartrate dehydrogenase/decarboxylase/D-malate dehydrogenase
MLDHLGLEKSAAAVRGAVAKVLAESKVRTPDLGGKNTTTEMGNAVVAALGG